jgi:hypothetical protein
MAITIIDQLSQIIGSGQEKQKHVQQKYATVMTALQSRRDRLFDNLNKYAGNIIPINAAMALTREDREAVIINLYVRKVQDLASAVAENIWDINFTNPYGEATSLLYALFDQFKTDQQNALWQMEFLQCLIYALISDASMEMSVNTDVNPMGNITWSCNGPGIVSFDPYWRSNKSADCEFDFKTMDLSAAQIKRIYQAASDRIDNAILRDLQNGGNYEAPTIDFARQYQSRITGAYKVIEYNYIEEEPRIIELDGISGKELPVTDDAQFKIQFCQANNIDLGNVRALTVTKKILKTCTICPQLLPDPLYEGENSLQIERLPHFPLSSERINGEPRSIIDIIGPMVQAINKRENNINAIMDYAAKGGGAWDPAIVGDNPAEKEKIRAGFGKAGFNFFTIPGALQSGTKFYEQLPLPQVPTGLFDQISHLWDAIAETIPVNATTGGKSDYAGEPGILFNLKMQAIERAQTCLMRQVENFLTEIGIAYVKAAKLMYSGATRQFYKPNGQKIVLNDVQPMPNGDIAILNDMSALGHVTVVVKLSPQSPNSRYTKRMTNLEIAKNLPTDPEYAEMRAQCWRNIIGTIEMPEDEADSIDQAGDQSIALAQLRMKTESARLQMAMQPPAQPADKVSKSVTYKDLPPEGQVQLAAQAGIKLSALPAPQLPQQPETTAGPLAPLSAEKPSQNIDNSPNPGTSVIPEPGAAQTDNLISQNASQMAPLAA